MIGGLRCLHAGVKTCDTMLLVSGRNRMCVENISSETNIAQTAVQPRVENSLLCPLAFRLVTAPWHGLV